MRLGFLVLMRILLIDGLKFMLVIFVFGGISCFISFLVFFGGSRMLGFGWMFMCFLRILVRFLISLLFFIMVLGFLMYMISFGFLNLMLVIFVFFGIIWVIIFLIFLRILLIKVLWCIIELFCLRRDFSFFLFYLW